MSEFTCPNCTNILDVNDMELWVAYEEDGKETEINCPECNAELKVTSSIIGWSFEAELVDEERGDE